MSLGLPKPDVTSTKPSSPLSSGGAHPHLDLRVVEQLRALAQTVARPGEDLPQRLVSLFVSEGARRIDELRAAWSEGRRDEARRVAHTIKGSARGVGAVAVAAAAAAAEDAVAGDFDEGVVVGVAAAIDDAAAALSAVLLGPRTHE